MLSAIAPANGTRSAPPCTIRADPVAGNQCSARRYSALLGERRRRKHPGGEEHRVRHDFHRTGADLLQAAEHVVVDHAARPPPPAENPGQTSDVPIVDILPDRHAGPHDRARLLDRLAEALGDHGGWAVPILLAIAARQPAAAGDLPRHDQRSRAGRPARRTRAAVATPERRRRPRRRRGRLGRR